MGKSIRFVHVVEQIRPNNDMRTSTYVSLGCFDKPQGARDRVAKVSGRAAAKEFKFWKPGTLDNERFLRSNGVLYKITRHVLQSSDR